MRRDDILAVTATTLARLAEATGVAALADDRALWLLMGTMAVESDLSANRQLRSGPARGFVQMEPATAYDNLCYVRDRFGRGWFGRPKGGVMFERATAVSFGELVGEPDRLGERLEGSLTLQVALARLHYWRVAEAIPGDAIGFARYWKRYYNTEAGGGDPADFERRYRKHYSSLTAAVRYYPAEWLETAPPPPTTISVADGEPD